MNIPGFQQEHVLGKGSYGTVYKAKRMEDDISYAVKVVNTAGLDKREIEDSVNEIRLIASFRSPFIIGFCEAFVVRKKLCVVTEYARLGDLSKLIDRRKRQVRPLLEDDIWRFLIQITEGLAVLHEAGVVHRDIKSANLLLCAPDLVKIGDLGVSTVLRNHTLAKTQIGTPLYLAPEIWRRRPYDAKCDMWSLGIVLFEMLNFSFPFIAKTTDELGKVIMKGRIGKIRNGYSSDIKEIVYALLQTNPDMRPSSAELLQFVSVKKKNYLLHNIVSDNVTEEKGKHLLQTIKVPKLLKQVSFPQPSYDEQNEMIKPLNERMHIKEGVLRKEVDEINTRQLIMIADHDWWSPNKLQIKDENQANIAIPLSQRSPYVPPVLPQIVKPRVCKKAVFRAKENQPVINDLNIWKGQVFYQKKHKPTPPLYEKPPKIAPRKQILPPLAM